MIIIAQSHQTREIKMIDQLKLCRMRLFLIACGNKSGLLDGAETPSWRWQCVGNVHSSHSVAATIRPPDVRMTAITREWLSWNNYSDKSEREGTFQRKYSRMRCAPGSIDVPRRIKLSSAGMSFSKSLPQLLT